MGGVDADAHRHEHVDAAGECPVAVRRGDHGGDLQGLIAAGEGRVQGIVVEVLERCDDAHALTGAVVHATRLECQRFLRIRQYHGGDDSRRLVGYERTGCDRCDLVDDAIGTFHVWRNGDDDILLVSF